MLPRMCKLVIIICLSAALIILCATLFTGSSESKASTPNKLVGIHGTPIQDKVKEELKKIEEQAKEEARRIREQAKKIEDKIKDTIKIKI